MTASLSPQQRLSAARYKASKAFPYFTQALMALVPRETTTIPTMAVSENLIMFWNPDTIGQWTVDEICAALVHEVNHVLREHLRRGKAMGAEPALFNIAGDLEINKSFKEMRLTLPEGCLYPSSFGLPEDKTAEEYYRLLQKQAPPPPSNGKSGGLGAGKCGSCASGEKADGEPDTQKDSGGRSQVDVTRVRQAVASAVQEHVKQHGRGSVPGSLDRWANETLKPAKVRWQDKLARASRQAVAHQAGKVDYRFSKPARKQAGVGWGAGRPVLPCLVAPVPRVMVAIDTSGSMGPDELRTCVSEVDGVLKAIGVSADFASCDADVNAVVKARSWREVVRNLRGGGGTDFIPVFEHAAKMRPRPEVLIFATDGCGPAPAELPYPMRVIWLLVGPYKQRPFGADCNGEVTFGEFIEVDDE